MQIPQPKLSEREIAEAWAKIIFQLWRKKLIRLMVDKHYTQFVLAINDTLNVLKGKWKLPIIGSLLYGKKRFKELEKVIPKITSRMLSKELKDLEANGIVKRTVYDSIPVMVEYELTKSGQWLHQVIDPMIEWGLQLRKDVIGKH